MIENGVRNAGLGAEKFGFRDLAAVYWNQGAPQLYEQALQRREAHIAAHGPLVADTGAHTGRSPKDKFIVRDDKTESVVWWDNNNAMSIEHFDALLADFLAHASGRTLFAQDLYVLEQSRRLELRTHQCEPPMIERERRRIRRRPL